MKCRFCDADLPAQAKYCENCGRFLEPDQQEKPKKPIKKRGYIIAGILFIAAAFVITMFNGNILSMFQNTGQIQASTTNLGFTEARLRNNFNDHSYAKAVHLAIGEMHKNQNGDLQYPFSDHLILIEKLDTNSPKIREILVIGQPVNKEEQVKLIASMGIMIDLFSADLSIDERKTILQELGFDDTTDLKLVNKEVVRGHIKYKFQFVKDLGFVFAVMNTNQQ